MNELEKSVRSEVTPFERLRAFTAQILAVPKSEIDRREVVWQQAKDRKRTKKK